MEKIHYFKSLMTSVSLPEKFTYPFHYIPHPLCVAAAEEVQSYLTACEEWEEELKKGKMFGVLVVRTTTGEIGYLAAFSGLFAGKSKYDYFVPPIYDVQEVDGFFRIEEEQISEINRKIKELQEDTHYLNCKQRLFNETFFSEQILDEMQKLMKASKEIRERLRLNYPDEIDPNELIRESQFLKAELKRLKVYWREHLAPLKREIDLFEKEIERLCTVRKKSSAALQQKLFEQFRLLNACGEERDLCDLFRETVQRTPPSGSGECAAPKLLQYAYLNNLQPIAMAEFWWGESPKKEIRRHGYYYPPCKGKCEPILTHMLKGLQVEENPLQEDLYRNVEIEIVYEDEFLLVVNKPAGMLTVPGKLKVDSVYDKMKRRYPEATGPMIVHRLDMATSGLLLVAKTKEVHQKLQSMFDNKGITKQYVAWLDGIVEEAEGYIELPLRPDPENRPYQIVDMEHGKPAVTSFCVLRYKSGRTLVSFLLETGRTHQLRVHAAHPLGLNAPIVGDELYGKKAERLYLHSEYLDFQHPITNEWLEIEKESDLF